MKNIIKVAKTTAKILIRSIAAAEASPFIWASMLTGNEKPLKYGLKIMDNADNII